ncbi:hypothetical protein [Paenibacillus sp. CAA11]|uniref:hypothetical protein n=1 Tax=Paenibacillus sp. CAA11 TaxID=1532905 RepID=UPI0019003B41|nr:hypothetical protein [Paenibacillus sp. CAA11]
MKKIAAITASLTLSAALATAAGAAPAGTTTTTDTTTTTTTTTDTNTTTGTTPTATNGQVVTSTPANNSNSLLVDEPIVVKELLTIAPAPLTIKDLTYFYDAPNGKIWNRLGPTDVTPTGQIVNGWVEIYTWLGKAWVYAPNYVPYPS